MPDYLAKKLGACHARPRSAKAQEQALREGKLRRHPFLYALGPPGWWRYEWLYEDGHSHIEARFAVIDDEVFARPDGDLWLQTGFR